MAAEPGGKTSLGGAAERIARQATAYFSDWRARERDDAGGQHTRHAEHPVAARDRGEHAEHSQIDHCQRAAHADHQHRPAHRGAHLIDPEASDRDCDPSRDTQQGDGVELFGCLVPLSRQRTDERAGDEHDPHGDRAKQDRGIGAATVAGRSTPGPPGADDGNHSGQQRQEPSDCCRADGGTAPAALVDARNVEQRDRPRTDGGREGGDERDRRKRCDHHTDHHHEPPPSPGPRPPCREQHQRRDQHQQKRRRPEPHRRPRRHPAEWKRAGINEHRLGRPPAGRERRRAGHATGEEQPADRQLRAAPCDHPAQPGIADRHQAEAPVGSVAGQVPAVQ